LGLVQAAARLPEADLGTSVLDALDRLRVAITMFDADERLSYSNTHYNYLFRSLPPFESLIGATYESIVRLELSGGEITESVAANAEAFVAERRRQLLEGDFRPLDIPLADGRIIELKSRPTGEGGRILLWSDATYSRRLLTRLEDTIEMTVDAFAYWSERDRLTMCNTSFAEVHGLASPDAACGLSFAELMDHAVDRDKFVLDGPRTLWLERRLDAHRAPVGALTVSTTAGDSFLVRERATRGGGSVTVLTDVSEHHRAESALAEQTRALERTKRALQKSKSVAKRRASYLADLTRRLDAAETEADTAKATLLRTMSHELKTPLNAVIGFADLLRSSPDRFGPEEVGEYAGLIHIAGNNLLRLINQILDLTKIAAGRYPFHREPVAVGAVLARALESNVGRAEAKSLNVDSSRCASELLVDADESALTAMLGQLIENAVNYTQAGGSVVLSAVREEGCVRIAVEDNGPGVAEADLERILEPFEQVGRGTSDHSAGAGLGLPIVKGLVELHEGTLTLQSALGKGFKATLEFPST